MLQDSQRKITVEIFQESRHCLEERLLNSVNEITDNRTFQNASLTTNKIANQCGGTLRRKAKSKDCFHFMF